MQIYADQLEEELDSAQYQVRSHQPISKLEKYAQSRLVMRYLRYMQYPREIATSKANIHHVTDHGYAHLLPKLEQTKRIVTVHDLIPLLAYRGLIKPAVRFRRPRLNEYSLSFVDDFDCVIAPSQSTAADLQEHLSIEAGKIRVIPPMISNVFSSPHSFSKDEFARRHGLKTDAYWVMISGQEFYKNHELSLSAVEVLRARGLNVKILKTGVATEEFSHQAATRNLSDCVHQIFFEDASEIAQAYAFIDCLVFPSYYEGFGMPVAEALACGTRVVASTRGSLPEVGGSVVPLVAPDDLEALVETLAEQLELAKTFSQNFVDSCQQQIMHLRPNAVVPTWYGVYQELAN